MRAFMIAIVAVVALAACDEPAVETATSVSTATETANDTWQEAAGNIWTGVTLYVGPKKEVVGQVLGGSNGAIAIGDQVFEGVKIRMVSGAEEWKRRDIIVSGDWFVQSDDPALKAYQWQMFSQ